MKALEKTYQNAFLVIRCNALAFVDSTDPKFTFRFVLWSIGAKWVKAVCKRVAFSMAFARAA